MSGRPAKTTTTQRNEVKRLAAEGASIRAIAETVFGDRRYRGRVERILRRPETPAKVAPATPGVADSAAQPEEAPPVEATATLRAAFDRQIARIAAGEFEPSLGELRTLMDVQRRLEARETLERFKSRARRPDRSD